MMSDQERRDAVEILLKAEREKKPAVQLSKTYPHIRIEDTYAIQELVNQAKMAAAGLIIGGRAVEPMDIDLRWVGALLYRNADIEETGIAAGVLGHPALGIAWLANKVGHFGTTLEPGRVMLSGSFTRPVWAQKGDTLRADFGSLGSLSVQFV